MGETIFWILAIWRHYFYWTENLLKSLAVYGKWKKIKTVSSHTVKTLFNLFKCGDLTLEYRNEQESFVCCEALEVEGKLTPSTEKTFRRARIIER